MERAYLDSAIDYTDKRPPVEVTVEILDVTEISVTKLSFDASFKVTLDWEEPDFIEGIHYSQDMRSGGFVLSKWLLEDPNSFNPRITIANGVNLKGEETSDQDERSSIDPKVRRLVTRSSGNESVWLTKEYSFEGTLLCQHVDAHMFPFDMQRLPIKIKSLPQAGLTTLGTERQVRLVNPRLRPAEEAWLRHQAATRSGRVKAAAGVRRPRGGTSFCVDDNWEKIDNKQAHVWSMHWEELSTDDPAAAAGEGAEEAGQKVQVGEMQVCAFGGSNPQYDEYIFEIVVVRVWMAYWFDFYIQILLLVVSLCSVWVPFNDDTIANRLSISLTVVLSIVFFATVKPAAIGELTYVTWHDRFEHITVFIATLIALENVWVYLECWGMDRDGIPDFVLGTGMILGESLCEEGFMRTSSLDGLFWIVVVVSILLIFLWIMVSAQVYQLRYLARVMDDLNRFDATEDGPTASLAVGSTPPREQMEFLKTPHTPRKTFFSQRRPKGHGKANRLSVNTEGGRKVARFENRSSDADLVLCIASHGLPLLRIWPSFWVRLVRGKLSCSCCEPLVAILKGWAGACCACCRRRCSSCCRGGAREDPGEGSPRGRTSYRQGPVVGPRRSFTDGERPSSPEASPNATSDAWIRRFVGIRPVLARDEPAYIVDVGTGELGFYQYRWRPPNGAPEGTKPMLFVETSGKLRLDQDSTFQEEFVQADYGVERFVEELLERFNLAGPTGNMRTTMRASSRGAAIRLDGTQPLQRRRKVKVLLGPTGQNRNNLIQSAEASAALEAWVRAVEDLLDKTVASDVLLFVPSEQDEATYELWATEWLVQNGDLDVQNVHEGAHGVPFAGLELSQALMRAGRPRASGGSPSVFALLDFVREFQDLTDTGLDNDFLEVMFTKAAAESSLDETADASAISGLFRRCPQLMRGLVKSRLFNGTISAGGGSCQITVKPEFSQRRERGLRRQKSEDFSRTRAKAASNSNSVFRNSEFHCVKLGNKTPLTGLAPMWPKHEPMTEQRIEDWRALIREEMDFMDLPPRLQRNLRGLYVGISAVYYAASLANCAETIMPKTIFLGKIADKLRDLLEDPPAPKAGPSGGQPSYDHRAFANLALVYEVVDYVLADTAWIVCKRNWKAQPADVEAVLNGVESEGLEQEEEAEVEASPTYVATWSLGFFLNQAS